VPELDTANLGVYRNISTHLAGSSAMLKEQGMRFSLPFGVFGLIKREINSDSRSRLPQVALNAEARRDWAK